jgi:hypothetical protein
MKKSYGFLLLVLVSMVALGASVGAMSHKLPGPDGEAFWTYISQTNRYEKWEHWPGYDGMYPGKSPHGAYLKLYANDIAIQAAKEGKPLPEGSILVKENYGKDKKTLVAITPMYKVKGYNPEDGDWFWTKYTKDGSIEAAGKVEGCIQCHRSVKADDYLFSKAK